MRVEQVEAVRALHDLFVRRQGKFEAHQPLGF
jgi:hypothetical protein